MSTPHTKDWPMVPLGEVASFRHGGTPAKGNKAFWAGDIPWVSPKDMHTDEVQDAEDHISAAAIANSATSLVPPSSLLMVIRSGILVTGRRRQAARATR